MRFFLSLSALTTVVLAQLPPIPPYQTKWFPQPVDHFDFQNTNSFQQRYLFADEYWGTQPTGDCPGPIFFYTGNESPIDFFYPAMGFINQVLAPKFGALLIYAEHRYFGESMPYGSESFEFPYLGFLSTDQALADFAVLIGALKYELKAESCPVFAFGGSYGGMLTAWLRAKYPNVVMGGLASSAPFGFLGSGVDPNFYDDVTTNTYEEAAPGCVPFIENFWTEFNQAAATSQGRIQISEEMNLCSPIENSNDAAALLGLVEGGLQSMAQLDYPYPADYGQQMLGWPVNTTCQRLLSSTGTPFEAMAFALGVCYNATGDLPCYNWTSPAANASATDGWPYLYCTSCYMPMGDGGMFPSSPWNLTADIESCRQQFGIELQPWWPQTHWGGFEAFKNGSASNIIFSNGLLDPWHGAGLLESQSDTVLAIVIPASAHHEDLRAPNPADFPYVTAARAQEMQIIGEWLQAWFEANA